jgi:hypothetical protein
MGWTVYGTVRNVALMPTIGGDKLFNLDSVSLVDLHLVNMENFSQTDEAGRRIASDTGGQI